MRGTRQCEICQDASPTVIMTTQNATTANIANNAVAQRCTQNRIICTQTLTPPRELIDANIRQGHL